MYKTLLTGGALFALVSCASSGGAQKTAELTLKNTASVDRPEATVSFSRQQLEDKLGALGNNYVQFKTEQASLTAQFEDTDADGKWDEALLLCPLKADERQKVLMEVTTTAPVATVEKKAHARMKLKLEDDRFGDDQPQVTMPDQNPPTDFSKHALPPYLTEGPGWENDKVAYRLYFDTRNNKDIYGKRIAGMVLDSVGANPANSYHHLSNWGMDILKVGSSLGAGALAFSYQKADGKDTLVRLGGNDIKAETYQLLEDGPLRASFLMTYPWQLAGKAVTVTEKISIAAGDYHYTSEIAVKGDDLPKDLKVDMGIADFYENTLDSISTDKAKAVFSYGKQTENHDQVGMAIISTKPANARIWSIGEQVTPLSDITSTYFMQEPISKDSPVRFQFLAGWELSDSAFTSAEGFKTYLSQELERLTHPIEVE